MKQKKASKKDLTPNKASNSIGEDNRIITDPQGSWTGVPDDPYEKPIQDADDL
ncbi:MAG: hypothetical protein IJ515_01945 [Clostridia bacterium]|nr:hypothetical protein [Clostridia bacterium]